MKKYWILENDQINPDTLKVINEFLGSLKLARRAETTITTYRFLLQKFFLHQKPLAELTAPDVFAWLNREYGDKKPQTIKIRLESLSVFFKFCQAEGYVNRILVKNRWRPRLPKPVPKFLDKTEQALVKIEAEKTQLRDRAIYEFLLSSGCRRAELVGLNRNDIDLAQRTAQVRGKGGKTRQVHFSETAAILLEAYLKNHPADQNAVFLNKYGQRLSRERVYRLTKSLGQRAGLNRSLSPHCFRHTFATNLLVKGADLGFIADELGHNDLNVTRVYARLPDPELVALYRKYMG